MSRLSRTRSLPRTRRRPVRRVTLRTETKRRLRGEVVGADERTVTVRTQTESLAIPYDEIVRGNLIEEG